MSTQNDVLTVLLNNKQIPISGQKLAEDLDISRNAVWKSIEKLREQNYTIESIPRKGYQLKSVPKHLDATQIKNKAASSWENLEIITKKSVTSTNDLVKQYLINHPTNEVLIAAKEQTEGRGRRGKSFYSSLDDGLYFSLGFKPKTEDPNQMTLYTVLAATALVKSLEKFVDGAVQIKWVNDLFYKNRKITGILSEMTSDLESGGVSDIIIGIGINVSGDFKKANEEVQSVAGSLFGEKQPDNFNQNDLLAEFLDYFKKYEEQLDEKSFLPVYKDHLLGLGKEVSFKKKNEVHKGTIRDIDENARLIVELPDGESQTLIAQEISFNSKQFANKGEEEK